MYRGQYPLHIACFLENAREIMETLLDCGADPNLVDKEVSRFNIYVIYYYI